MSLFAEEKEIPLTPIEDVTALKETAKAVLCEVDGFEHWIPRSLIHSESQVKRMGDVGVLVIPTWKSDELGLSVPDEDETPEVECE